MSVSAALAMHRMRLTTIYLAALLFFLAMFWASIVIAERLRAPQSIFLRTVYVVYAPTFAAANLVIPTKDARATVESAVVLGLVSPALYAGLIVFLVAVVRKKGSANKAMQTDAESRR